MPNPTHGIILIRSLSAGGAEKQAIEIASSLQEQGLTISILVFYGGGPLELLAIQRGIRVINLDKRGRWDIINFLFNLSRTLRSERPTFIYSLLTGANIISALIKKLAPSIKVIWSVRASDLDMNNYDFATRLTTALEAKLSNLPDFIIANSKSGRDFALKKGFPANNLGVVSNGIDIDQFHPSPRLRAEFREQWGITTDQSAIGLAARLDPMKGHEPFLTAAKQILLERPTAIFVIAGNGPDAYRQKLLRLSEDLGIAKSILWIAAPSDMNAVYNGLDVVISASVYGEGTSNTICEAMACGTPCIVTDVGDSALIVGPLGPVVRPGDPSAICDAFLNLAEHLPDPASLRERIIKNFSREQLGIETNAILKDLL